MASHMKYTTTQLHKYTQTRAKLGTTREARTSITVPEQHYKYFFLEYPKWSTEAGTSDHNSGLWIFVNSVHGWLVAALYTLMISLFYQEISVPT